MIDIKTIKEDDILILNVVGDVDASSSIELDTALKAAIESKEGKILVDCANLNYISSAGLGVFMSYIQDIKANNIKLVICGLSEKVYNVFEILGLHQLLTIKSTTVDAKAYLNEV
jgi:anti-sigma B factor antagonist